MPGAVIAVIAVLITLVVAVPITYFVSISNHKKTVEAKIGSAEERARKIIDDALKTAETKKREALLEVKEESLKTNSRKKPGREDPNFRGMRSVFFPKKKQWTRKQMPSRSGKQV